MSIRPHLDVSTGTAQTEYCNIHGSQIAAVYQIGFFILELWCWMAQIGNVQALDGLASDLERAAMA
jgi:hypothetical protein